MGMNKKDLGKIVAGAGVFALGTVVPIQQAYSQSLLQVNGTQQGVVDAGSVSNGSDDSGLKRHQIGYDDNYEETDKENEMLANYVKNISPAKLIKSMAIDNITRVNVGHQDQDNPGDSLQQVTTTYFAILDSEGRGQLPFEQYMNIKNQGGPSSLDMLEQTFKVHVLNTTTATLGRNGKEIEVSQNQGRDMLMKTNGCTKWEYEIVGKKITEAGTEYLIQGVGTNVKLQPRIMTDPVDESAIVADFKGKEKKIWNGEGSFSEHLGAEAHGLTDFNGGYGGYLGLTVRLGNFPLTLTGGYTFFNEVLLDEDFRIDESTPDNVQGPITGKYFTLGNNKKEVQYNATVGLDFNIGDRIVIGGDLYLGNIIDSYESQEFQDDVYTANGERTHPELSELHNPTGDAITNVDSKPYQPVAVGVDVGYRVGKKKNVTLKAGAFMKTYDSDAKFGGKVGVAFNFNKK